MTLLKKAAGLAAGLAASLAIAGFGQRSVAQDPASEPQTIVVDDATLEWIERSNVAALREGVIDRMELKNGMPVAKGKPIGYLHSELAELSVKKAELAAKSHGPVERAKAQKELAISVVARNTRLNQRIPGSVSPEEVAKAEAELKVATAMILEEQEKVGLAQAELDLAKRALDEHTIVAPFDGVVMERMKNEGESVRANEAVVKLGNLSHLRAYAYVPLDYALLVKEGQPVDLQVRLNADRPNQKQVAAPIEKKRFRGKVTFVDPQIQAIAETAVRIYAEFDNPEGELRPGFKGSLTIYLNAPVQQSPTVGARAATPGVER